MHRMLCYVLILGLDSAQRHGTTDLIIKGQEGKRIEFFPPRDTRSGAAEVEEHAIYVESTICYLAGEYPRT